jgi:hypothetical protein
VGKSHRFSGRFQNLQLPLFSKIVLPFTVATKITCTYLFFSFLNAVNKLLNILSRTLSGDVTCLPCVSSKKKK